MRPEAGNFLLKFPTQVSSFSLSFQLKSPPCFPSQVCPRAISGPQGLRFILGFSASYSSTLSQRFESARRLHSKSPPTLQILYRSLHGATPANTASRRPPARTVRSLQRTRCHCAPARLRGNSRQLMSQTAASACQAPAIPRAFCQERRKTLRPIHRTSWFSPASRHFSTSSTALHSSFQLKSHPSQDQS